MTTGLLAWRGDHRGQARDTGTVRRRRDHARAKESRVVGVLVPEPPRRLEDQPRARRTCSGGVRAEAVDNDGKKVDLTMAYVGTRAVFERAGFTKASDTDAVSGGFPRVLMRLELH